MSRGRQRWYPKDRRGGLPYDPQTGQTGPWRVAPPPKRWEGGALVMLLSPEMADMMYDADPTCAHEWALVKWSGFECNDCPGWFRP